MKNIPLFAVFVLLYLYSYPQWIQQESGTDLPLNSICMVEESNGWIAGDLGAILHYDGSFWSTSIIDTNINFRSIHAVDNNNCWVTGNGVIYHNNGTEWILQYSSDVVNLHGIFVLDSVNVWAVGDNGTILFYNGMTWSPQESSTAEDLYDVCFIDENNGWAVGGQHSWTGGIILNYNDGEWFIEANAYHEVLSVSFIDANYGWAAGGYMAFCMFYDGDEWEYIEVLGNNLINGNLKDETSWFEDIDMVTTTCGWIIGGFYSPRVSGGLYAQCTSGNWGNYFGPFGREQFPHSVAFLDSLNGWMVGSDGLIFYTNNGGIVKINESLTSTSNIFPIKQYPNPFTTSTTLTYTLDKPSTVTINIFNPQGQLIEKMEQEQLKGEQRVQWNAEGLPAGIYYFKIQAGDRGGIGKMVKI